MQTVLLPKCNNSEEVLVQMNGIGVNQPGNFHVWLSISHHRAGVNTLG